MPRRGLIPTAVRRPLNRLVGRRAYLRSTGEPVQIRGGVSKYMLQVLDSRGERLTVHRKLLALHLPSPHRQFQKGETREVCVDFQMDRWAKCLVVTARPLTVIVTEDDPVWRGLEVVPSRDGLRVR